MAATMTGAHFTASLTATVIRAVFKWTPWMVEMKKPREANLSGLVD
jgi:hypothetical protein